MKLIALVSGGKDSIYSLCRAVSDGHEIECLAHICSYDIIKNYKDGLYEGIIAGSSTELDSWMYQSVASEVVPLLSVALERQLYLLNREDSLDAEALEKSEDYHFLIGFGSEVDFEIVRLYRLLKHIKENHPTIEGIVSGAIFSTYQKTRIELVCRALNLTSISPLWEREQSGLLREMIENEIGAVLVKVSSIGLQQKHLMKSLSEMENELNIMSRKFGVHVCGEGGEYESFTLDCPQFKNKIVVDEYEIVVLDDRELSQVAHVRFKKCHLKSKESGEEIKITLKELIESKRVELIE